jgi:hypothetical protein
MSGVEPGPNGTTIRTVLAGQSCACAGAKAVRMAARARARRVSDCPFPGEATLSQRLLSRCQSASLFYPADSLFLQDVLPQGRRRHRGCGRERGQADALIGKMAAYPRSGRHGIGRRSAPPLVPTADPEGLQAAFGSP